jgi:hypothetical protein
MVIQQMIDQYKQRRDDAKERLGKGHGNFVAYWNIVDALTKPDPKEALLVKIAYARDAIVRHDQENWNNRSGYREYYRRYIELLEQALQELDSVKEQEDGTQDARTSRDSARSGL